MKEFEPEDEILIKLDSYPFFLLSHKMAGPLNKERRARQFLAKATTGLPPVPVHPAGQGAEE